MTIKIIFKNYQWRLVKSLGRLINKKAVWHKCVRNSQLSVLFYHKTGLCELNCFTISHTSARTHKTFTFSLPTDFTSVSCPIKSLPFVAHLLTNRLRSHFRQPDILANDLILHFTKIWSCIYKSNPLFSLVTHMKLLAWRNLTVGLNTCIAQGK